MLISMTGFGEARSQAGGMAVTVEVRTINCRHLKFTLRSSEGYSPLEPQIEAVTREVIRRGTVQLNLRVERGSSGDDYHINTEVLENYRRQIEQYTGQTPGNDPQSMQMLLSLPGAVDEKMRAEYDPREDWPAIEPVIREALAAVSKMRA